MSDIKSNQLNTLLDKFPRFQLGDFPTPLYKCENIEKEFSSKIRAIKSYKNEFMEFPHPRSVDALESIAKRWGTVSGYKYAEAFKLIRLLKK